MLSEHPEHSKQKLAAILIIVTISSQFPPLGHPPQPPPSWALSLASPRKGVLYTATKCSEYMPVTPPASPLSPFASLTPSHPSRTRRLCFLQGPAPPSLN